MERHAEDGQINVGSKKTRSEQIELAAWEVLRIWGHPEVAWQGEFTMSAAMAQLRRALEIRR